MEDKRNHEILDRLVKYISEYNEQYKKGGQAKVCRETGLSATTLSQYISGNYATPWGIEPKIEEYLNTAKKASEYFAMPEYVPTSISENIYQSIRNAHLTSSIIIEYGDAGIGKTKAALKYCNDHVTNTIMITANPCKKTQSGILRELCRSLSIPTRGGADMFDDISARLSGHKLVIVDEAQNLTITAIETLRALWDLPTTEFGMVFIGNHAVVGNTRGRHAEQFAQLNNRIKRRPVRTTRDVKRSDIELLFPEITDDSKSVDFLFEIAKSLESIRGVTNLYVNAMRNGDITYKGLYAVAKDMRMELSYH